MRENAVKAVILLALFCFLLFSIFSLRPFASPADSRMDDYFIRNGQQETGSNNIVTAVVFDYRGFDTLGEASVLFAAATGVFLLFGREKKQKGKNWK